MIGTNENIRIEITKYLLDLSISIILNVRELAILFESIQISSLLKNKLSI